MKLHPALAWSPLAWALLASSLLPLAARAENHALIMWIGDYGDPRSNLPGIDLDAANARKIATAMGVPARNITELSNGELTRSNMKTALVGLQGRIRDGDKVFLYYSGHGGQLPAQGGTASRCTEALIARDGPFFDGDLQTALTDLGNKASQVVMMNDSCFSGGAATRALVAPRSDMKPKFLPPEAKANSAVTGGYACGDPTNTGRVARSLGLMARDVRGPQVLYIAASNDTQVSFATPAGSLATLAWAECMNSAQADTDRSGRINGQELQACAQAKIDRRGTQQTIMLQGNAKLPLSFAKTEAEAAAEAAAAAPAAMPVAQAALPAPAPSPAQVPAPIPAPAAAPAAVTPAGPPTGQTGAPAPAPIAGQLATPATAPAVASPAATVAVNAAQALVDLKAGADRAYQVRLTLAKPVLRIGHDLLDFSVSTNKEGFLYILQVGSDGKTYNLLFPNKIDDNNFVAAGSHRFPRDSWRIRAAGPAGTSHLLAVVSPVKKDLSRDMDASSVFPSADATANATRTLVAEATGGNAGGSGRYGASDVVAVRETP